MLYVKKNTLNTLKVTIKEKDHPNFATNIYKMKITNDMTMVTKELTLTPNYTNTRWQSIVVYEVSPENLANGKIELNAGSHTYEITSTNNSGDTITVEKGKMTVYPDQTLTTENRFGTEVTSAEHTTTDTNTIYIKI